MRRGLVLATLLLLATAPAVRADDPGVDPVRARLAALVAAGDDAALLGAADNALSLDPECVPALEHRAFALQRLGRIGDARAAYERLLDVEKDHVWALTRLGAMHSAEARWAAALTHLERALSLSPSSVDAQRERLSALRGSGDLERALAAAVEARTSDATAGWAWRAEAEIAWAGGDIGRAEEALAGAERAGEPGLERLREVVDLDARLLAASDDPDAMRAAWAGKRTWDVPVGSMVVRSSVGPRLPGILARMLRELPGRFDSLFGAESRRGTVVVSISRTLDEHERVRRVLFPAGSVGRAFTTSSGSGRDVVIHLAWTSPDVATSLAHELAHASLRRVTPVLPVWLDEGLATYVEKLRFEDDELDDDRRDLHDPLRAALDDGTAFTWPRMFAAQRSDFEGRDGRLRYAQAWSMVRFLLEDPVAGADASTRRARLVRLLRSVRPRRGPPRGWRPEPGWADWSDAIEEIYGVQLVELEAAWTLSAR